MTKVMSDYAFKLKWNDLHTEREKEYILGKKCGCPLD